MGKKVVLFIMLLLAATSVYAEQSGSNNVMNSIIPNSEASWSAAKILMTVFGAVFLMALAGYLAQTAKGLSMGFVVKSWNVLAPNVSSIRFGTATGFYDSPVKSIGPFAVWCQSEKKGEIVIDRIPHGKLVNDRLTITNTRSNSG